MKKKKTLLTILIISLAVILLLGIIALVTIILPLKDYTDRTPDITPNTSVTAECGETLLVSELCTVECKGNYTLDLFIIESQVPDAYVNQDKQSIYVGSSAGIITVSINGRGDNAESRAEKMQIYVNMDPD